MTLFGPCVKGCKGSQINGLEAASEAASDVLEQAAVEACSAINTACTRPQCPDCKKAMKLSDYSLGMYKVGWECNNADAVCGSRSQTCGQFRWFCQRCRNDFCVACAELGLCEEPGPSGAGPGA